MNRSMGQIAWAERTWLRGAQDWIDNILTSSGMSVAGPLTQPYVRPWSTVLHVPTTARAYCFKATAPYLRHEVMLTQALANWHASCTLPVLAVDVDRGWMLTPAGGVTLRQVIRADHDLRHWLTLLPTYAELQIELSQRVPDLLALGVPDRRLGGLPELYRRLLNNTNALSVGLPIGITDNELQELHDLIPYMAACCTQLANYGLPESLHHGDLHDGNIFVMDGSYRFFDWGDSCVSHPFFSLRTAFVSVEMSLGLAEGAAEFALLRDAYLAPWTRFVALPELQAAFSFAQPLAAICGALAWHWVISQLAEPQRAAYAEAVPALLREFMLVVRSQN